MDTNTISTLRKTSSGLGFLLFAASLTMYSTSFLMMFLFLNKMDNTVVLLIDIIVSIISLFLVGIIYCMFSSTRLSDVIKVKWVKLSLAVPLILISLTISFTADYLAEALQGAFSIFGIENSVNLSTKSHSLLDNILNIVAVSIIPPLVEEFLFRGILLGKLRAFGDSFALFFSTMLFSLMHGNIVQIPFSFIVGLTLAFVTIKTDSL
ncbi:MAG: CPBP family intramembrane metalloprotease, partial [Ruminococcus sp.]|nr:CPBP family intramembrane metalloprotease [Ruminococcus sp.]